jgi:hypothetical protein
MIKIFNMDLKLIKKLLEQEGTKIIIVENGQPTMIISSFREYFDGLEEKGTKKKENPGVLSKKLEEVNSEESKEEEAILLPSEKEESQKRGLTIDDLPL